MKVSYRRILVVRPRSLYPLPEDLYLHMRRNDLLHILSVLRRVKK